MKSSIFRKTGKRLLSAIYFITLTCACFAQDIILTKDSRKIEAKVTEVNIENVKYKIFNHQDGPLYTIPKSDIVTITYQNGLVDTFGSVSPTPPAPAQTTATPAQPARNQAQATPVSAQKTVLTLIEFEKNRKFQLSLGFSPFVLGDDAFFGGNLLFGYLPPSKKHLFAVEFSGGGGISDKIGSYSYTITTTSGGKVVSTETKSDGKVSYEYTHSEFLFSWNMLFNISAKWKFRVGPGLGVLSISGKDSYSPTTYSGVKIEGIPESQSVSEQAAMIGVNAGLTCNFAKRWFLDMNYRLSVSSGMDFKERNLTILGRKFNIESKEFGSIGNRISLSVGWRF